MATGMRALLDTVVQALPQVSPQNSSMPWVSPLGTEVPLWPGDSSGFGGLQKPPGEGLSSLQALGVEFFVVQPEVCLMGEAK